MRVWIVCIFIFVFAGRAFGQTNDDSEPSRIRNPQFVGARGPGMGDAFAAVAEGADALYWNPAGMAFGDRYEFQFMHANLYGTDIGNNYLALLLPNIPFINDPDNIAFGLSLHHLGLDDNELRYSQNKLALSLSYRASGRLSFGANVKYLDYGAFLDLQDEGRASGWGADFGALFMPVKNLRFGLMVQDAFDTKLHRNGADAAETLFPRNVRVGAAYKLDKLLFFHEPMIAVDVDDRYHVGLEGWFKNILGLRAGVQKSIRNIGEQDWTFSAGLSLRVDFIQTDFAFTDTPFLEDMNRYNVQLLLDPPTSPVKIDSVVLHDLFASQKMYHSSEPWARVFVSYRGKKTISGKIEIIEKKFGIKAEKNFKIDPNLPESRIIDVPVILPDRILALGQDVREPLQASVIIDSKTRLASRPDRRDFVTFRLNGRNNIYWLDEHGVAQAAAFVMPEDALVAEIAARVQKLVYSQKDSLVNKTMTTVAAAYNFLRKMDILYKQDPNYPDLDVIQYPRELLQSGEGDCDDMTILLASVLESLGVNTALIGLPGHLLLAFDTGIHATRRFKLCVPKEQYVVRDGRVWLPVETTWYGKPNLRSFLDAWKKGAAQYHEFKNHDAFEFAEVALARETHRYTPLAFSDDFNPSFPVEQVIAGALVRGDLQPYHLQRAAFVEENYERPFQENPGDFRARYRYARLLELIGDTRKGRLILDNGYPRE